VLALFVPVAGVSRGGRQPWGAAQLGRQCDGCDAEPTTRMHCRNARRAASDEPGQLHRSSARGLTRVGRCPRCRRWPWLEVERW